MAHMQPETWNGGMWICEAHGETQYFPEDIFSRLQAAHDCGVDLADVFYEKGWWSRLQAPGYMDVTDWNGPFETEKAALDYLYNLYDVNAKGDTRSEAGWAVDDDLDDDDEPTGSLHGLGETPRRNRKIYTLTQAEDGRWVFRYGPRQFQFQNEELFFPTRAEAVRIAQKNGWVVEDNDRLRRVYHGGMSAI